MAKTSTPKPVEKLAFEEAFSELEALVSILEGEQRALDESMALFERGQALIKRCAQLLDQAELRVRQISGEALEGFEGEE